jgi:hypothetical protein
MADYSTTARIAGSALAGGLAFIGGFYVGFFLTLSIWGLDSPSVAFVLLCGGLGSLAAAGAIAWTVSVSRRPAAVFTAVALGAVLVVSVLVLDADALAMVIGGAAIAIVASILVRTGMVDSLAPLMAGKFSRSLQV